MTIPFVCVGIAFALIYATRLPVMVGQARQPEGYDNQHPRDQEARLSGWYKRAHSAHLNAIEAFAPFAAAVFVAHLGGADPAKAEILAVTFVAARAVYPFLYIANQDKLRTSVWTVGFAATIGLFLLPWIG